MNSPQTGDETRRSFLRKAGYVAPAVLTLKAVPAFASYGSRNHDDDKYDDDNQNWLDFLSQLFDHWGSKH